MSFILQMFGGMCCDPKNSTVSTNTTTPSSRRRGQRDARPRKRISGAYEKPRHIQWQQASNCQLCEKEFTLTLRQHHCRKCGRVVCFACSECKDFFDGETYKKRICNRCVDVSQQDLIKDWSLVIEDDICKGSPRTQIFQAAYNEGQKQKSPPPEDEKRPVVPDEDLLLPQTAATT